MNSFVYHVIYITVHNTVWQLWHLVHKWCGRTVSE